MASIDTTLVDKELRAIIKTSQVVKKITWSTLERMESDPASFEPLDDVPASLREMHGLELRKAMITHQRHDFRVIFAHWTLEGGAEHVDLLLVFRRKRGYEIDWEWIEEQLVDDG